MPNYYPGSDITLYANYTQGGVPINAGVSGNSINVYYFENGVKFYNVMTGTMTQDLSNPSTFYYNYSGTVSNPWTNSIAEYDAEFSGTSIQITENISAMPKYQESASITLYTNYTSGGVPIVTGISSNTIDIYYYSSGTKIYNVQSGNMTQDVTNPSMFFYEYTVPSSGLLTNSIVQYNAVYSGNALQNTETFFVIPQATGNGIGSVVVSGQVVTINGSGIQNALVSAALYTGNSFPIATTVTDISGNYSLNLDPNNYNVMYSAGGYTNNAVAQSVPSGMTYWSWGQTSLLVVMDGPITISDQFIAGNRWGGWDNWGDNVPLSGLRVSLFGASVTTDSALAITYTDVSGNFSMNVYNGRYVLLVEGTQPNNQVFNTAYDIDVDTHFIPKNFRYLGTSQYRRLI